jgi:hypothetical protein
LLKSIYIPDLIKVDLTTGPARLSGTPGFSRLGVFGGDVLKSQVQDPFKNGGFIPGGWPNGRRFGDDVVNIGFIAVGVAPPSPTFNVNRVDRNDITYNNVFPPMRDAAPRTQHRPVDAGVIYVAAVAIVVELPGRRKPVPDFQCGPHPRPPSITLILPPQSSGGLGHKASSPQPL